MKSVVKKSALIALLGLGGAAAHAEGFNFYALLDAGVASSTISGAKTGNGTTSEFMTGGFAPNFFGLSAEKKMEGGVTGGFKLETGFLLNPQNSSMNSFHGYGNSIYAYGNNNLFNRQANLYVKSDVGTFALGTQDSLAFDAVLVADPRSASNYGSSLASVAADGGSALPSIDVGAFKYTAPTVSGFTVAVEFVPRNNTSASTATKLESSESVKYSAGPLTAVLAGRNGQTGNTATVGGLTYKIDSFTVKGLMVAEKTPTYQKLNTYGLGGLYAYTPAVSFDVGVYNTKDSATNYNMNTAAAGVYYNFVKDLTLYGQYANVKNNGSVTGVYNFTWTSVAPGALAAGSTGSTVNVGLLYAFF